MKLTPRQCTTYLAHLYKAAFKSYHAQLTPLLERLIAVDGTVIDVGAHAGQFTKIFARIARNGQVYAFEPSSYARSILQTIRTVKRLNNVTVLPVGLGDAAGQAELRIPVKQSGSIGFGSSHLKSDDAPVVEHRDIVSETIEITTLDDFAQADRLVKLSFIKADIEGWELHMLHGATSVLMRYRPVLMLEVNGRALRRAGHTKEQLFAFLGNHDYTSRRLGGYDGKSRGRIDLTADENEGDFFCFPREGTQDLLTRLEKA